jgi:DNA-binding GntR family transcriptional regulator
MMPASGVINIKSLREQVYDYLKTLLVEGRLTPGVFLDLKAISQEMGISKTPLRDALLHLESEGFITILPRRGVMVSPLTLRTIRNIYEMLGALESVTLLHVKDSLAGAGIDTMATLNETMSEALSRDDFESYYQANLDFHDSFLDLSTNEELLRTVRTLKQRLYDFPRKEGFVKEWELESVNEHARLVELLREARYREAASFVQDVHWSFEVQEEFIRRYYFAQQAQLNGLSKA